MNYSVEINNIPNHVWDEAVRDFRDYTIYQTWAYQSSRATNENQELSRIIIRDVNDNPSLMCIVRIKRMPLIGLRIGYVQWGPLIHHKGKEQCLREELWRLFRCSYVPKIVDILRIVPNIVNDDKGEMVSNIICMSGFEKVQHKAPYRTMILAVDLSDDKIRSNFHRSWRRGLKKAESYGIEIKEGSDAEYFDVLEQLYTQSVMRKKFRGLNPQIFSRSQQSLCSGEKINVVVAYHDNDPIAAHSTSHLGDTAVGILAAANEKGLESGASYLVWWKTLLAARQAGMKKYDLGGIDPQRNPDVYQYKKRMGAMEQYHIGTFETCSNVVVKNIWSMGERLYNIVKK